MAHEYKLNYTASEINEKLSKVDAPVSWYELKDRPFGEEIEWVDVTLWDMSYDTYSRVTSEGYYFYDIDDFYRDAELNKSYLVTFDNVNYELSCLSALDDSGRSHVYIGNPALYYLDYHSGNHPNLDAEDNGIPFCISLYNWKNDRNKIYLYTMEEGPHSVKVVSVKDHSVSHITPIDLKFMPEHLQIGESIGVILDDTLVHMGYNDDIKATFTLDLVAGNTYYVTWNMGIVYEVTAVSFENGPTAIGNLARVQAGDDTGEPFLIYTMNNGGVKETRINANAGYEYLLHIDGTIVKPLELKYIPEPVRFGEPIHGENLFICNEETIGNSGEISGGTWHYCAVKNLNCNHSYTIKIRDDVYENVQPIWRDGWSDQDYWYWGNLGDGWENYPFRLEVHGEYWDEDTGDYIYDNIDNLNTDSTHVLFRTVANVDPSEIAIYREYSLSRIDPKYLPSNVVTGTIRWPEDEVVEYAPIINIDKSATEIADMLKAGTLLFFRDRGEYSDSYYPITYSSFYSETEFECGFEVISSQNGLECYSVWLWTDNGSVNGEVGYRDIAENILPDMDNIMLTSPNGTQYKLTVSDDGMLSAVEATPM